MSTDATPGSDGRFPDRGPAVFAVTTATLVLATVFVTARLVCRRFIVKHVSWDDWIMGLAWCIACGLSLTILVGVKKGLGRHDADVVPEDWGALRRCQYAFSILYNPALMATKTSLLIFYLRLSKNTEKVLRFGSWLNLVVVNLAGAVLTFMNIFQCQPVKAAWEVWTESSRCIPLLTEFICASPVNIVTDLAILALPIPVMTKMRLPPRQKTILVITFSVGIFVTIVDVVRIYYLQQAVTKAPTQISNDPNAKFGGQPEFAWNASLSLMWSAVEVNVGMTCACVPTLKPLILRILPSMIIDPNRTKASSSSADRDVVDLQEIRNSPVAPGSPLPEANSVQRRASVQVQEPAAARVGGNRNTDDSEMTLADFLATGPSTGPTMRSRGTATTTFRNSIASGSTQHAVYFGFVNMQKPKSMLRCSTAESWKYCTAVTVLFLLWGMSYGLLNTLNNAIAEISNMTVPQTLGLTSIYFGAGYFFGPLLVGEWILRRDEHRRTRRSRQRTSDSIGGFKATFIVGLCIYGIGTIIFWPSAVTNSFGGFMLSNFVVGFGLAVLETGANAFVILCGPHEYCDMRIMLSQGVQGVGAVVSGLLARKVFFSDFSQNGSGEDQGPTSLINVQWTYLAITLVCVLLALFFYYMPLPEVTDEELEKASGRLPVDPQKRSFGGFQLRTVHLVLAVMAQWTYVAAQEGTSIFFRQLVVSILPGHPSAGEAAARGDSIAPNMDQPHPLSISIPDLLLIAHSAFAGIRFVLAYVIYRSVSNPRIIKPRTLLSYSVAFSVLFALLTVVLHPSNPNLLLIPLILLYLSEGPCWPLIVGLALKGQGRRTKRAAAFITMGASGPAFFPFIMYAIIRGGGTVQISFIVVLVLQTCTGFFPFFLDTIRDAKMMVDPIPPDPLDDDDSSDNGDTETTPPTPEIPEDRRQKAEQESSLDSEGPRSPWEYMSFVTTAGLKETGSSRPL